MRLPRLRRRLFAALIATVIYAPPALASDSWSTTFNDDLEVRYWRVPERIPDPAGVRVLDYVEQVNRLIAQTRRGPWSISTQIDQVALLANRYFLNDVLVIERELVSPGVPNVFGPGADVYANVEKLTVRRESRELTVQIGDSYAAFGRGIALNLNRNVDIDIDTSIQGVKATARPGDWDVEVLLGQLNRQQVFQDNPNRDLTGDLRHGVIGARAERFGVGPANLGAHAVLYDFVTEPGLIAGTSDLSGPDAVIRGATAEINGVAGVDWFVEVDHFQYLTSALTPEPSNGWAAYASATTYIGKTIWQAEFKRYRDAERLNSLLAPELYEVAIAPTLEYERAITEDSAATLNSNNVTGGRLRVDWSAVPGKVTPWISAAVFRDTEIGPLHFNTVPETVVHPLLGVEWIDNDVAVLAAAGIRTDIRDGTDRGADRQLHADASLLFPITAGLHGNVSLYAERYQWGVNPFQQADYSEVETSWSVSYGSDVTLTWFTDYSSNPLIGTLGNLPIGGNAPLYGAVELQVKPSSALTLKAFYGAYKAGIRCSGGQCRLLPGFEGARFTMQGTF